MKLFISLLLSRKLSLIKSPQSQQWYYTWYPARIENLQGGEFGGNAAKIKFGLGFCHLALGEFWIIHDWFQPKATSFHVTDVGF